MGTPVSPGNPVSDPVGPLLLRIAAPASVGFFFNTMYNLVDTYYGGRLGTDALAALSLSFPVFIILLALGQGISTGSSALIANSLGAGDTRRAVVLQAQAVSFALVVTALTIPPLLLALPGIFRFMNASPGVLESALRYARVITAGSFFLILNGVLNAGLTARGDTRTYRNFLIGGFFANIVLDPLLMYGVTVGGSEGAVVLGSGGGALSGGTLTGAGGGITVIPAMGEAGIALATVGIQAVGVTYLLRGIRRTGSFAGAHLAMFRPRAHLIREIAGQSFPSALNFMMISLGTFVITYFISRYGTEPVAAYGAALRIEQVALIPTIGLNIALATMVGQNNGAGRLDRVRESYHTSLKYGIVLMVVVLTPVLLLGRSLLGFFTEDAAVRSIGLRYLYIQALTFFSYVLMNQSNSVLQGLKRPGMIMWVGLYRQVLAPLAVFPLLTEGLGLEETGVWWGLVAINWSAALWTRHHAVRCMEKAEAG
jgi:Na+-driven multidrug efflux pump